MDAGADFVPSTAFVGAAKGYAFKSGDSGAGYYRDDGGAAVNRIAVFDPSQCPYCAKRGFAPLTIDGGVLKKVLRAGQTPQRVPEEGCPTAVQFTARLEDGEIYETTRNEIDGKLVGGTDDPHEFQLLREKWIRGADLGVASMSVGEVASFVIRPQ
jgi:hypothetical protein